LTIPFIFGINLSGRLFWKRARRMQLTLEEIKTEILGLKKMANHLEANEEGIEQLVTDVYKIEMKANALREVINKTNVL
jgi:hypothetical protein